MSKKTIKLAQVRVGMFITDLDVAWFKSPFFTHQRAIASKQDIAALQQAGVKTVVIDTDKGVDVAAIQPQQKKAPSKQTLAPTSLKDELNIARKLKHNAQKTIQNVINSIQADKPVVAKSLDPLVRETLDSISRNDQALLTLLHMEQQANALITHSFNVMSLCLALGKLSNLEANAMAALGQAALMHDVGWSKLPKNLLAKGKKYTPSEEKLVKQHVPLGLKILEKGNGFSTVTQQIITQHHEYDNGRGYPNSLTAKQIHPLTKLLSVIDCYDELIHGLNDSPGMISNMAMKKLYAMGKQGLLDLGIVTQLVHLIGVYPPTSAITLNTGEKALVVQINRKQPLLPVITIYYNSKGTALSRPLTLDLTKQSQEKQREINGMLDLTKPGADPANVLRTHV